MPNKKKAKSLKRDLDVVYLIVSAVKSLIETDKLDTEIQQGLLDQINILIDDTSYSKKREFHAERGSKYAKDIVFMYRNNGAELKEIIDEVLGTPKYPSPTIGEMMPVDSMFKWEEFAKLKRPINHQPNNERDEDDT